MQYVEYGAHNLQTVILLHGGGLSWWNYRDVAQLLSDRFHVVLPILDGHADSDAHFTSIEDNAARIIAHIDEHFGGKVLAVGGLSLGGQIAVEMLTQRPDICRFALLESTFLHTKSLPKQSPHKFCRFSYPSQHPSDFVFRGFFLMIR